MSLKFTHCISKRFNAATLKGKQTISLQQHADWTKNGFIVVRALFDKDELSVLRECIELDTLLHNNQLEQGACSSAVWKHLGNDTYGNFMASNRMYRIIAGLSNNAQMQHFYTKLMTKHSQTEATIWSQNYGKWYHAGWLFPDLITGCLALNDCNSSNGCLEIVPGSHSIGRIEHHVNDRYIEADEERMKCIESVCDKQLVELKKGDTLFFHCNLLHRWTPNKSDQSQNAMFTVYNKKTNTLFKQHEDQHSSTDVDVRADSDIKKTGVAPSVNASVFMTESDKTVKYI